ncbi:MAG: type IX secretion system sortase PorU [Vicingaceae bacterium]
MLKIDDFSKKEYLFFNNAKYATEYDHLPIFQKTLELKNKKIIDVELKNIQVRTVQVKSLVNVEGFSKIPNEFKLTYQNSLVRKKNQGTIIILPIRKNSNTGQYEQLISFDVAIKTVPLNNQSNKSGFATTSKLASGTWYKIAVVNDGVYKISYNFLKSMGIDVDNIDPTQIKIYGHGGGMLPKDNSAFRYDDLVQNAIEVVGESDGVFNQSDYVLFYGQSPHKWLYDTSNNMFVHELNEYSDSTFYFINVENNGDVPKRILNQNSLSNPNQFATFFDDYQFYEKDFTNLIKSGRKWFGDYFDATTTYNYAFNFPNLDPSSPAKFRVNGAARSSTVSNMNISVGGNSYPLSFSSVQTTCYYCNYFDEGELIQSTLVSGNVVYMTITYNKPNSASIAWLDFIEVNVRRNLFFSGNQLKFRDLNSVGTGNITQFTVSNANNSLKIWDISDPVNIYSQQYSITGTTISFSVPTDTLKEFIVFNNNYDTLITNYGVVQNQNLHGLAQYDFIIIAHPKFLTAAQQLADYRTNNDGLSVVIVTPQQIYNEFSSGSRDIVAIRDFVRMFYKRAVLPSDFPKYLLFMGDGSYDNKNRLSGNIAYIPTYQSYNSYAPTGSYVSDDFYGLLDDNEGTWQVGESIDIGIGRLPVKSSQEALDVVNKIINYNTPSTMKDWRNIVCFVGDDEDGNTHMNQANSLAAMVETGNKDYVVEKIFFDAYQQESTPGGERYPDVNKAINERVTKGALMINYTGHGGEVGWAHERVLGVADINNWENKYYNLMMTATCEFSRFDDPSRTSAGELTLLNPNGGTCALLTTVRLVYSTPNFALNQSFYNHVFTPDVNNNMPKIGDVFMNVKNDNKNDQNTRNFTLLGDPSMQLAYPEMDVITTKINGNSLSVTDTIKALETVTFEGYVADKNGNKLTNYNGTIYPTVYDKERPVTTLANDGGNPFQFNIRDRKLFKGKASVVNGDFSFSFVVPKDIAYNFNYGKINYYAEDQQVDANGYYDGFLIGGTATNYAEDNTGPEIELYMNDRSFVYGGMTDENPTLLAYVSDVHGINMVGNGIGHDITAILDNETEDALILNDYYEADLNSYQKGVIKYPFEDLPEGKHTLTLKVWDVYNNSSEATIEFYVVKSKDIVLDKVYNYPNPFTTYTEFWFEHNQPGKPMWVQVQIYTISGKLVKTIEQPIVTEGYRSSSITWDGLDDYGDRIGRGVYIYRLKVRADNFSTAEKYQKLVILK